MAAKRKLFLTHAGELAHLLLRDVGRDGLVAHFARSYSERYHRKGLLSDPARLPELEITIGREALLVMAGGVRKLLSQEFPPGPKGMPRPDDAAFLDAFYAEFLASLIRGFRWSPVETTVESQMFRRDLEMYRGWGDRPAPVSGVVRADEAKSPFPDRCALLLDSAMMEQARRAAADFERQLLVSSARRFLALGRSSFDETAAARRSGPKSAKRPRKSFRSKRKLRPSLRKKPSRATKKDSPRSTKRAAAKNGRKPNRRPSQKVPGKRPRPR